MEKPYIGVVLSEQDAIMSSEESDFCKSRITIHA